MKRGGLVGGGWMGGGYFTLLTCRLPLTRAAEGSSGMTALSALGCVPPLRSCADSVSLSPPFSAVSRVCVRQSECERACARVCECVWVWKKACELQCSPAGKERERQSWGGVRSHDLKQDYPPLHRDFISKWSMLYEPKPLYISASHPQHQEAQKHSPRTCMPCRQVESWKQWGALLSA